MLFANTPKKPPQEEISPARYLRAWLWTLAWLIFLGICMLAPYSFWWLYASGDVGMERAVTAQARGDFLLFGSGVSQDFMAYKLRLYGAVKPEIIAIGSSRVMQFRGGWFREKFLNMGGVAGNLAELRHAIDAILKMGAPKAVILGLDFWWFLPQWEKDPEARLTLAKNTYNYGLDSLKMPWIWLLDGKISLRELATPIFGIFGKGFRADRQGIMAQQTDDGFGPDGSWYYTAESTGQKPPFDFQFGDTLKQVEQGIKAFYHAKEGQAGPAISHMNAFAEIWCRLKARGIQVFGFIPPLAPRVYNVMRAREKAWPHLFHLRAALLDRGIEVMDFANPATLNSSDCEFVDGFHGGEVAYARILLAMADHWPRLLPYVNMEKLDALARDWRGHVLTPDSRLTQLPEIDFMRFGCPKKRAEDPRE